MENIYVTPTKGAEMKTYVFQAQLEQEEDGRWSAWIDALPGCAVWGYTKEEAFEALKDAAQAYIEVLLEKGKRIPSEEGVSTINAPLVAVTV
jgi:predicted RNase H-like HicB family nuclease